MTPPPVAVGVLTLMLGAGTAQAAACCLSSTAFGIGRLSSWEHSAVLLGFSTSPVLGRWEPSGAWKANGPGVSENEWRWQASALMALHSRFQLSGRVPVVLTTRELVEQRASGGGLGDVLLGARFEPVYQGEYEFLPEIALNLGVTLPSGRVADANSMPALLGTDVTGRGAWIVSGSVVAELARKNWFLQAGGGMTIPLITTASDGGRQQFGLGAQVTLAGGLEIFKDLVLSLVTRFGYEGPLRVEPRDEASGLPTGAPLADVPGSQAYDFGGGPNVSYKISSHWTLQAGADFSIPAQGLGANRQGRITANAGVRFAYF